MLVISARPSRRHNSSSRVLARRPTESTQSSTCGLFQRTFTKGSLVPLAPSRSSLPALISSHSARWILVTPSPPPSLPSPTGPGKITPLAERQLSLRVGDFIYQNIDTYGIILSCNQIISTKTKRPIPSKLYF